MVPWCEAHVPVAGSMVPCRAPAVACYRYRCALNHEVTRSVCGEHDPVPGEVGCYECKTAGTETPMTWELVQAAPGPPQLAPCITGATR